MRLLSCLHSFLMRMLLLLLFEKKTSECVKMANACRDLTLGTQPNLFIESTAIEQADINPYL